MKKWLIVIFSMFLMGVISAQSKSNVPDPKLVDAWGQETVDYYMNNAPDLISYYNFFLNYSYKIIEMPDEKMSEMDKITEFKLKDKFIHEPVDYSENGLQNLNIMKYDFQIDQLGGGIFRLGNTKKLIVFYSGKEIQTMYNETIKKSK